ncbi:MAG: flagellar basal body P-ring protein FlgI [Sedimentisphaerales bacterium]
MCIYTAVLLCCCVVFIAAGCAARPASKATEKNPLAADNNGLGATVSSVAEVFAFDAVPVKGYALVGGLEGTGSTECPPQIRSYLEKYILQHLGGAKVNIDELIRSPDTAVVAVEGAMPPGASQNERFDVSITALSGTQTTSLKDGSLYGCDLYEARQFGSSIYTLATAEGPVFVDLINPDVDMRTGYILGGGVVTEGLKINLIIRHPDYRLANLIGNRINEKFGSSIATALAPGTIELQVPAKYSNQKYKFLQLVRATYLADTPELIQKRIQAGIQKLASSGDKNAGEITLEAIGNAVLPKLAVFLNSTDPEVRFRTARCMLNLGDKRATEALWSIATDKASAFRIDAINAIALGAAAADGAPLLRTLLGDDNSQIRLAAYENLVRTKDPSLNTKMIAGNFYLDQISTQAGAGPGKPVIFVSRRNQARVALFGAPIRCRNNVFIETPDGSITINVPANEQNATLIRKHPKHPNSIIQLKSSLDLADIIQTLCSEPVSSPEKGAPGLGVSYSSLVALLKQMVDSGAVVAEFQPGPLPIIKK